MESKGPRIAIIGAGIAGLSLSHGLTVLSTPSSSSSNTPAQQPQIDIYESSPQVTEIGAGINIWPRTWEIMKSLGLAGELRGYLPREPDYEPRLVFEVRKADQVEGYHIYDLMSNGGTLRLHRKTLHRTLLSRQPQNRVHLSKRFASYSYTTTSTSSSNTTGTPSSSSKEEDTDEERASSEEEREEIVIKFTDGTTATCDILIGADGIRSAVRREFLQHELLQQQLLKEPLAPPSAQADGKAEAQERQLGDAIWSGTYAYRGLVPVEKLEKLFPGHRAISTPMMYSGKLKHIICYPLPHDGAINVVGVTTDLSKEGTIHPTPTFSTCDKTEVLNLFEGWEEEVQTLLQCIETPLRWALMTLVPLDRYARGRVALVGDAAHGMTPHQGAGAGQAFDDIYTLSTLLTHPLSTSLTIPTICRIYDAIRQPEGNRVMGLARRAGLVAEFVGGEEGVEHGVEGVEIVVEGVEKGVESDSEPSKETLRAAFESMVKEWDWVWNSSAEDDARRAVGMFIDQVRTPVPVATPVEVEVQVEVEVRVEKGAEKSADTKGVQVRQAVRKN